VRRFIMRTQDGLEEQEQQLGVFKDAIQQHLLAVLRSLSIEGSTRARRA
jgi:hypothetical protein